MIISTMTCMGVFLEQHEENTGKAGKGEREEFMHGCLTSWLTLGPSIKYLLCL